MTIAHVIIVACGLFAGYFTRPISTLLFDIFHRLSSPWGSAARFASVMLATAVVAVSLLILLVGPLWLFGLIPLGRRTVVYYIAFLAGAAVFALRVGHKRRRNRSAW